MSEDVKTKFKGPGEWRSQVARLEGSLEPKKLSPAQRRVVDRLLVDAPVVRRAAKDGNV